MTSQISEGLAQISVTLSSIVSKELPVFYNPLMKHNRDVSLCIIRRLIKVQKLESAHITLPLAGSGVRGIRVLREIPNTTVSFNDKDANAVASIKHHVSTNNISSDLYTISQMDASEFLFTQKVNQYIELDPFGSPNHFLDASIRMLSRGGILAVTATDTAPLCGAYPLTCKRKYDAIPHNGSMCQEIGLRILIRKVQVIGAMYDKALIPVFSYPKDHYMRVYFLCKKSKSRIDEIQRQHEFLNINSNEVSYEISPYAKEGFAGPLYTGPLFDKDFCDEAFLSDLAKSTDSKRWVEFICDDVKTNLFGYYDIHAVSEAEKIDTMPKMTTIIDAVLKAGYLCSRTAFNLEALRTNIPYEDFVAILRSS